MAEVKKIATRESYGNALVELGQENPNVVVLDADLAAATKTGLQENAVYGKVPCFIHVCREGKSERMSCRLTTPRKKFDNFKTNYI